MSLDRNTSRPVDSSDTTPQKKKNILNIGLIIGSLIAIFILLILFGLALIDERFSDMNNLLEQAARENIINREFLLQSKISLLKKRMEQMTEDRNDFLNESKMQHLLKSDEKERQNELAEESQSWDPVSLVSGIVRILMGKSWQLSQTGVHIHRELEKAYIFERNRKYNKAIQLYETIQTNRDFARSTRNYIRLHLGFCYAMLAQYNDARRLFIQILDNAPRSALRSLAVSLFDFSLFLERKLSSIRSTSANPLDLAETFYYYRDFGKAIPILEEEQQKQQPSTSRKQRISYFLGRCHEEQGNLKKALNIYTDLMISEIDSSWSKLANRRLFLIGKFYEDNKTLASTARTNSRTYKDGDLFKKVEDLARKIPVNNKQEAKAPSDSQSENADQDNKTSKEQLLDPETARKLETIKKKARSLAKRNKPKIYQIRLRNGTILIGRIIRYTQDRIMIATTSFGTRSINRDEITMISRQD